MWDDMTPFWMFTLWLCQQFAIENVIEIVDFPIEMVDLSMAMLVYRRV